MSHEPSPNHAIPVIGDELPSALVAQKGLLIAARNITGERNGRIAVLETAVRALQEEGHHLTILALTSEPGPEQWLGAPVIRLSPPPLLALGARAAWNSLRGGSLNESIFDSAALRRQVTSIAQGAGAQAVLADGIRIWPLLRELDLPVMMHLDDLLSDRYRDATFVSGNASILGYFSQHLPQPLVPVAERVVKPLLSVEARRLHHREIAITRQAHFTALTSHTEARTLSERSGVEVHGLPMAVDPRPAAHPAHAPAERAVFLGALYYGPNMAALRFLRDEVFPILRQRGHTIQLDVIGAATEAQRAEFAQDQWINVRGYVDDLSAALDGHRMFLSPVTTGTGVKTKVLDGMSVGLPVIATPLGVAGIPVTHGVDALIADTAPGFAEHIETLIAEPQTASRLGQAGRNLLEQSLSSVVVRRSWRLAMSSTSSQKPTGQKQCRQGAAP